MISLSLTFILGYPSEPNQRRIQDIAWQERWKARRKHQKIYKEKPKLLFISDLTNETT